MLHDMPTLVKRPIAVVSAFETSNKLPDIDYLRAFAREFDLDGDALVAMLPQEKPIVEANRNGLHFIIKEPGFIPWLARGSTPLTEEEMQELLDGS